MDQFFGNVFLKLLKDRLNIFENCYDSSDFDMSTKFEDLFSLPSQLSIPIDLEVIAYYYKIRDPNFFKLEIKIIFCKLIV